MRAETRRQLKQDRFSRTTLQVAEQTVHWTVEHQGKLIVGAIVLVVAILAALGSWYYLEKQNEKASADFGKAVQVLDTPVRPAGMPAQPDQPSFASLSERAAEAHKQFQAVSDKYPHTRASDFSHYFLGTTAASVEDDATAERELKQKARADLWDLQVHDFASFPWARSLARIGKRRMRLPVAAKIALVRAGAAGGTPGSPTPVGFSSLGTM